MTQERKSRGRPKGSEINDDKMLAAVADKLIADPDLKPTTAMRGIKRDASDAEIHRWQDKWKQRKDALLAAAAARATSHEQVKRNAVEAARVSGADIITLATSARVSPALAIAIGAQRNAMARFTRSVERSGVLEAKERWESSSAILLSRRLHDKTLAIQNWANAQIHSPLMLAARGLGSNPLFERIDAFQRNIGGINNTIALLGRSRR